MRKAKSCSHVISNEGECEDVYKAWGTTVAVGAVCPCHVPPSLYFRCSRSSWLCGWILKGLIVCSKLEAIKFILCCLPPASC